MPGHPKAEKTI